MCWLFVVLASSYGIEFFLYISFPCPIFHYFIDNILDLYWICFYVLLMPYLINLYIVFLSIEYCIKCFFLLCLNAFAFSRIASCISCCCFIFDASILDFLILLL